jgi:UDP-2,3-diacylglucosamine pyrophosphatase LpxH
MAKEYYFISDLHIGGDGALDACEFETEMIEFLRMLERDAEDAELIIAGDLLGLWEFTTLSGVDKLHAIIASHFELFRQFQRTGSKIRITVIPGNHDHELATDQEFGAILLAYNMHLEPVVSVVRPLAGRTLWIEHGHQHDDYNRFEAFGNPACKPFGYYVTTSIISGAGQRARNRTEKWIKDIESVYPTEYVPHWLLSNYFYREMSTYIQVLAIPFLLAFSASAFMVLGALLELCGLVAPGRFLSSFTHTFGMPGYLLDAFFLVGGMAFITMVLFTFPLLIIRHDIRKVLLRYNLDISQSLREKKNDEYTSTAERIFREHPDVVLFVFGHSHIASLNVIDGRAIINTGSWIKRLTRVPSRFFLLPDVYYPSYQLGYFHVLEQNGEIAVNYHILEKRTPHTLSLLQRLSIYGQRPDLRCTIPVHTKLPCDYQRNTDETPVDS